MRVIDPSATITEQFYQRDRFMSSVNRWVSSHTGLMKLSDPGFLTALEDASGVRCEILSSAYGSHYSRDILCGFHIVDARQYSIFLLQYD